MRRALGPLLVCTLGASVLATGGEDEPKPVEFAREIRPILAEKCLICHGPNDDDREAELRFDVKEVAFADRGGYAAIVPGDSAASEMVLRITDELDPMPPPEAELELTPEEIELIRRWIDEGAEWGEHWAYVAPVRPEPPPVADAGWAKNPIDRFVLARLEAEGLAPSPEASKERLIRRATFDLTGLPPTIGEVDAFLADDAPDAYEQVVDRLLASPRYGERMAKEWLDVARYGDTHGYHLDNERALWRWRDWVIEAFNANKPFDEFTIEQLAGDLLPDATLDQRIATGFNRCNPSTGEGGLIAEEYLAKYAFDRVETTATVWLGTTMGCTQCHDHKYDPFTQREFYELFAFFNSVAENASDANALTPPPAIKAPTPEQARLLEQVGSEIGAVEARLIAPMPEVDAAQAEWEREFGADVADRWHVLQPLSITSRNGARFRVLADESILVEGPNPDKEVYEILAQTDATGITAVHLEALTHESMADGGVGRATNANIVLSEFELETAPAGGRTNDFARVPLSSAFADHSQENYRIDQALDGDPATGWGVVTDRFAEHEAVFVSEEPFGFADGTLIRVRMRFESQHAGHAIGRFRLSLSTDAPARGATLYPWYVAGPFPAESGDAAYDAVFPPEEEVDLSATYLDGAVAWQDRPDFVDRQAHTLAGGIAATYLCRTIHSPTERDVELSLGSDDGVKVWLNGELVLDRRVARPVAPDQERFDVRLRAGDNRLLMKVVNFGGAYAFYFRVSGEDVSGIPLGLAQAATTPLAERTTEQTDLLRDHYRSASSPEWEAIRDELVALEEREAAIDAEVPMTMVMEELATPREAHLLIRGQYDQPGELVEPGTPAILPPMELGSVGNAGAHEGRATRLELARWLMDPGHPLPARVTVNRWWQRIFGHGLVGTTEDFGSRGDAPTHPDLLDWLATELVESGWDIKHMQKLMVTSAAYRQSARVTPELLERDPKNQLYARGPRFRLDAEAIRDNALAVSGLLVEHIGGPSVRPYQPAGLWKAVGYTSSNTANFTKGSGEQLYRRSMYTFWKRTSPPPSMQIFDAPTRESCIVQRARTNTPLQALTLMNDVQFVEAARAFAQRTMQEGGATADERAAFAFRAATARHPEPDEQRVLLGVFEAQLADYRADPEAARELVAVGDSAPDAALDPSELAAWTVVCSLILNLDEVVTRG
ncbi:MAG: PSD1 and planctomycete cytochrome C domain-containing protein [Planctomycetota bacterium]|nr:PSD1 and planctomycete cytochrome C domain-containing protein [Planctomycetota bacterium]